MASVAKLLGSVCLLLAVVAIGLSVYGIVEGVASVTPFDETKELSDAASRLYLLGALLSALVLATIGSTALVAVKSWNRLDRDHRRPQPPPPPVSSPPAQAVPVEPWRHPVNPQPPHPPGAQPPPDAPKWGPPTGAPLK